MKITNYSAIESLGQLLATYDSDLFYISNFKLFINGKVTSKEYAQKESGYFQTFLNEFKIARNVKKGKVDDLLIYTKKWIKETNSLDVDVLALNLRSMSITQDNKTMISLASKLLFLHQPANFIPVDTQNRRALNIKSNKYAAFEVQLPSFIDENQQIINEYLILTDDLLTSIENKYKGLGLDFRVYRINRFADKLLWVKGKYQKRTPAANKRLNS